MRTRNFRFAMAIGSLLISPAAMTACSSPPASPTAAHPVAASAAATPTPSPALGSSAQAALTAYETAWADAAAVQDSGNYQDPRLQQHFAGQLLLAVSANFYVEETRGIASRGAPILHPRMSTEHLNANPPTITITDCIDFRHFIQYYAATGRQYGPVQTGLSANTTTMTLVNGAWMATDDDVRPDGSCHL